MKKYLKKLNEILYYLHTKLPNIIIGRMKNNLIYTHWGRGMNNFGDCLSPSILKHYGFTPVYCQPIDSDIILAGTILQWTPKSYSGIILGTGCDDIKMTFNNATVLGVRGDLTLRNIYPKSKNIILGDPGLIMNYVYPEKIEPIYDLGIVPHFVDYDSEIIKKWKQKFGHKCLVINVLGSDENVIRNIKKCKNIISSSLHGLIIADAFNIPNVRFVDRSTMPTYFFDYKFEDYYTSFGTSLKTIEAKGDEPLDNIISETRLHTVEVHKLQNTLNTTFKNLKEYLKQ